MKKILLLCLSCCLAICLIIVSCSKSVKIPLSYSVTDSTGVSLKDIFIPDSGTYNFPVWVKFLSGYAGDKVTLSFSGLPSDVKVTPDSFGAIPTYTERFAFYTNNAVHATYPITLVAYTPTSGYKYFKFNLSVIPAVCTKAYITNFTGANSCNALGLYHYTARGDTSQWKNIMYINNFAGYGTNVNVQVLLDCTTDSLFIDSNFYGNNVRLRGQGIFTSNKMIIWHHAYTSPYGPDDCVDTLTVAP